MARMEVEPYQASNKKGPRESGTLPRWLVISQIHPATPLSLAISIGLAGFALFNLREMIQQGPQGSAAVGFAWLSAGWFFLYLPLTVISLIASARNWRTFAFAFLVALFPWGMFWLIDVIVRS